MFLSNALKIITQVHIGLYQVPIWVIDVLDSPASILGSDIVLNNNCYTELNFAFIEASGCKVGDTFHNGRCYALHSEKKTFEDAEKACNFDQLDGHLAAFHSEEGYDFLRHLIG